MLEPTEDELLRGVAALIPFVEAYRLPLNPENLDEMAYAVLRHARSTGPLQDIALAVRRQIAEERAAHAAMLAAMDRQAGHPRDGDTPSGGPGSAA